MSILICGTIASKYRHTSKLLMRFITILLKCILQIQLIVSCTSTDHNNVGLLKPRIGSVEKLSVFQQISQCQKLACQRLHYFTIVSSAKYLIFNLIQIGHKPRPILIQLVPCVLMRVWSELFKQGIQIRIYKNKFNFTSDYAPLHTIIKT